jgi:hypothetical protein
VDWQSALEEKKWISLGPSAIAASIPYRCEIDLSPGNAIEPTSRLAGRSFFVFEPNNSIGAQLSAISSQLLALSWLATADR